jgi:hypothetical protein
MRWNFFKSSHFTKIENEIRLDFLKKLKIHESSFYAMIYKLK